MKKIHDQHVHSYYSFDSKQPIEEYLNKAIELGLEYFVLTDHCDLNYLDKGQDIFFDIKKQHQELDELQKKYPNIKILKGIEIGYKPSELDRINQIIKDNKFDIINLSLHESDGIDYYFKEEFLKLGVRETLNIYFKRQLEAVKNFNDFDVFCHIDYGFKTAYQADNSIKLSDYEDLVSEILKEVIKKDKALEINTKVQKALPKEHTIYLLNLYKKAGGKHITISSDAHSLRRFYEGIDEYLPLIKEAGFNHITYFIKRNKKAFNLNR